jgi:hypothetical protein
VATPLPPEAQGSQVIPERVARLVRTPSVPLKLRHLGTWAPQLFQVTQCLLAIRDQIALTTAWMAPALQLSASVRNLNPAPRFVMLRFL